MVYIGNFHYITNQQEKSEVDRRHGEFNLLIKAKEKKTAIQMFKNRIYELKESSGFFEGDATIFFNQLLEFDEFPSEKAMIFYYKSVAGDPLMPFISCATPSSETDDCRIFQWEDEKIGDGKQLRNIFIEFKS